MTSKADILQQITINVRKKHPHRISQDRYKSFFGELPQEFLIERLAYDNLLEKAKHFKLCQLVLSEVKVDIKLTLDQCIAWEIGRWEEASAHNILPNDIKKLLKQMENK